MTHTLLISFVLSSGKRPKEIFSCNLAYEKSDKFDTFVFICKRKNTKLLYI